VRSIRIGRRIRAATVSGISGFGSPMLMTPKITVLSPRPSRVARSRLGWAASIETCSTLVPVSSGGNESSLGLSGNVGVAETEVQHRRPGEAIERPVDRLQCHTQRLFGARLQPRLIELDHVGPATFRSRISALTTAA
jgi:hypothetical protein